MARQVSLGRVVGSTIRNGNVLPTSYVGWLEGDIFVLNDTENNAISYYVYSNGKLTKQGILSGEKGDTGAHGIPGVGVYSYSGTMQLFYPGNIDISKVALPQGRELQVGDIVVSNAVETTGVYAVITRIESETTAVHARAYGTLKGNNGTSIFATTAPLSSTGSTAINTINIIKPDSKDVQTGDLIVSDNEETPGHYGMVESLYIQGAYFYANVKYVGHMIGEKGAPGETGRAGTITIGEVNTGLPGTDVIVTNTGTEGDAILNFTIPAGKESVIDLGELSGTPFTSNHEILDNITTPGLYMFVWMNTGFLMNVYAESSEVIVQNITGITRYYQRTKIDGTWSFSSYDYNVGSGGTITGDYLPKSGGIMTGDIIFDKYKAEGIRVASYNLSGEEQLNQVILTSDTTQTIVGHANQDNVILLGDIEPVWKRGDESYKVITSKGGTINGNLSVGGNLSMSGGGKITGTKAVIDEITVVNKLNLSNTRKIVHDTDLYEYTFPEKSGTVALLSDITSGGGGTSRLDKIISVTNKEDQDLQVVLNVDGSNGVSIGNVDDSLTLIGWDERPKYYDGNSVNEIALLKDIPETNNTETLQYKGFNWIKVTTEESGKLWEATYDETLYETLAHAKYVEFWTVQNNVAYLWYLPISVVRRREDGVVNYLNITGTIDSISPLTFDVVPFGFSIIQSHGSTSGEHLYLAMSDKYDSINAFKIYY